MPLKITNLNQLSTTVVQQSQQRMSQLVAERYPDVDLTRGAIHDVICFLAGGVIGGVLETEIQRVLDSRSLLAVQADPTLADTEIVDNILSNFRVSRRGVAASTGEVRIIVSVNLPINIPRGTIFSVNGISFVTSFVYTARPVGTTVVNSSDRVLRLRGDGAYEFTIPAVCQTPGEIGNIKSGSNLIPNTTFYAFVSAAAATDFSGGVAEETTTQLLARLADGIPAKVAAGSANIVALLSGQYYQSASPNFSVIGFGEREQFRDQIGLFPISSGSRTDVYIKSKSTPAALTQTLPGIIVSITGSTVVWQVSVDRDALPGFYRINSMSRTSALSATSRTWTVTRGFDTSQGLASTPAIKVAREAAFSRYQTASVIVTEVSPGDLTSLIVGARRDFAIVAAVVPGLRESQDFINGLTTRALGSDVLLKGAVPCFVTVAVDLVKPVGAADPDVIAIKALIASSINNTGFIGAMYATQIAVSVASSLSADIAISRVTLSGSILQPDEQTLTLSGTAIEIPDLPSAYVTARTTGFFAYSDDIRINIGTRD